jgi:NitT/TauT family transport system substrate-binding protein
MSGRPSMFRRSVIGALAAAVVLVAAACGGGSGGGGGGGGGTGTPAKPAKVDVGTLPISNAAPMYLGMRKGFFRREGLELQPHVAQNGAELITGALSGSYDFIFAGYIPSIVARAKSLPITVVAASDLGAKNAKDEWTITLSKKSSAIRTPKDLAGKTIAVNGLRGVGEVVIKASLEKQGVDPDSIKLLEVPFPEMPAALERGRVDAIWSAEPFLSQELARGAREIDAPLVTLAAELRQRRLRVKRQVHRAERRHGREVQPRDEPLGRLRAGASGRGARDDPDVHEDPRRGRGEDPPARMELEARPPAAPAGGGVHAALRDHQEGAEGRRDDLEGRRGAERVVTRRAPSRRWRRAR